MDRMAVESSLCSDTTSCATDFQPTECNSSVPHRDRAGRSLEAASNFLYADFTEFAWKQPCEAYAMCATSSGRGVPYFEASMTLLEVPRGRHYCQFPMVTGEEGQRAQGPHLSCTRTLTPGMWAVCSHVDYVIDLRCRMCPP